MDSVPTPPVGVCFKRENFTLKNFSADNFLQDLWNTAPLEVLRDDLGSYLKVLRSAMIELINRDYADFVNLSGNLVGLEVVISNLEQPLLNMHVEILAVEMILRNACSKLQVTLSERQSLREHKLLLECLLKIPLSVENLEKLLNLTEAGTITCMLEEDPLKGNIIGRAANEYNQLQHLLVKCNSSPMLDRELKQRIATVNTNLIKCLETVLFFGIENHKRDVLQKTLHTFVTLDQCKLAVNLVRVRLVHPAFERVLNKSSLKTEPQDLNGLINKLKDFIRHSFKDLIEICRSFEGLRGFTFVYDCLWPEFYTLLVTDLECVFAQGNPDIFHKRFISTMDFIDYLDNLSYESQPSIKNDTNYYALVSRWNLPVYFQMRFQELAGALETALKQPFDAIENSKYNFRSTDVLLNALMNCYATDIYIAPLAHRFWKLSLQMLGRYKKVLSDMLDEQLRCNEEGCNLTPFSSSGMSFRNSEIESLTSSDSKRITLQILVRLDVDVRLIISELAAVWNTISEHLALLASENRDLFKNAFQTSAKGLEDLILPKISQLVVSELTVQSTAPLKHVLDIPRLYRRTNKEIPTKPFGYVDQLLVGLQEFRSANKDKSGEILTQWTHGVIKALSVQYLAAVSDVLTSVQKTEDSLKRLRKDRNTPASSAGISDDDKIRIQLAIDVDSFVKEARLLTLGLLPELQALLDAVEQARHISQRYLPT
nr:EOG090X03KZ [Megafenestra aurita]